MKIFLMRYYFNFISVILCTIVTSCSTLKIDQEYQQQTKHQKILGSIGEQKGFILEKGYNSLAFPYYENEILLSVKSISFNSATFKAFIKAKVGQSSAIQVNYADSLAQKPKFITLDIADRVLVLEQLKLPKNAFIHQFLSNKVDAQMVTSLALVLKPEDTKKLESAETVVLIQTSQKTYEVVLYTKHKPAHTIQLKDAVVFGYQASKFCWKQSSSYKLELIDLVETNDKCPNNSYSSASSAKKNINYFKL